ncbi:MAG: hypothetical protein Kow00121_09890 [Elainellaceae cyanobacterium]
MLTIGLFGATAVSSAMASVFPKHSLLMAQTTSLSGSWRLANMTESAAPTPMVPSTDTELTADFADGRITGSGGCNRFMGGYETQGEQLSIGPLASTFMACEEAVMNQETRYLSALQGAQRYEIDDQGQLTIVYQTEQESGVLRFVPQSVQALW